MIYHMRGCDWFLELYMLKNADESLRKQGEHVKKRRSDFEISRSFAY